MRRARFLVLGLAAIFLTSSAWAQGRPTGLRVTVTDIDLVTFDVTMDVTLFTGSPFVASPDGLLGDQVFTQTFGGTQVMSAPDLPAIAFGEGNTLSATDLPTVGPGTFRGTFVHTYPGPGTYPLRAGASSLELGYLDGAPSPGYDNPLLPVASGNTVGAQSFAIRAGAGFPSTATIVASDLPTYAVGLTNSPGAYQPYPPTTGGDLNIPPVIDLVVSHTESVDPVAAGDLLTHTITALNNGPSLGTNITLDVGTVVPAGTTAQSIVPSSGTFVDPTWTIPSLAAAGSATLTVTFDVTTATLPGIDVIQSSATVTGADQIIVLTQDDASTEATSVISPSLISATKTVAGDFAPNGAITYTIVLTNDSTSPQVDDPGSDEFVDVLPFEVDLVGASADSGTATADVPANTVRWNGSIPEMGSVTITIDAQVGQFLGIEVANQGEFLYDADGDGLNDTPGLTDDPGEPGDEDPTVFVVGGAVEIPTASPLGLGLLALLLLGAGVAVLRSRGRASAALFVVLALAAGSARADDGPTLNLAELTAGAETILVGTVRTDMEATVPLGGLRQPAVTYLVEVESSLLGSTTTIKGRPAVQPTLLSPKADGPAARRLVRGERLLLFLGPSDSAGIITPVGLGQGVFRILSDSGKELAVNDRNNAGLLGDAGGAPTAGPISLAVLVEQISALVDGREAAALPIPRAAAASRGAPPPPNTDLGLGDDDTVEIPLPFPFTLCGQTFGSVFVNSNGSLTFGAGSLDFSESSSEMGSGPPRIAGLWDDLNPTGGGSIFYDQTVSTFTVTWEDVPEFPAAGANSFTIQLRRALNTTTIDWGALTANDGLVGVSCGPVAALGNEAEVDLNAPGTPRNVNMTAQPMVHELFSAADNDLTGQAVRFVNFKPAFVDVFEPNDSQGTAAPITPPFDTADAATAFSAIDPVGGDVDYFSFSGVAGTTVVAEITAGSLDSVLGLFELAGGTLVASDDDGGSGLLSRLVFPITTTGDYALAVSTFPDFDFNGDGLSGGRYLLDVQIVDGTILTLGDDASVVLPLGFSFPFQGSSYTDVNVNSNGNLTFGGGDNDFSESVAELLAELPRIAMLWDDLSPNNGGLVLANGDATSMTITFQDVPEFINTGANSFDVTLFATGDVEIVYGAVSAADGIVGVTEGGGAADPGETDLSPAPNQSATGTTYEQFTGGGDPFDLAGATVTFLP